MHNGMFGFRSVYFDDPPQAGRALDIFPADGSEQELGIFFIHGGGWHGGARANMHPLMWECGRRGYETGSVDYRLSPGMLFKQIEDTREGLELFLQDRASRGKHGKVLLFGSSAGAHIALMVGLAAREHGEDLRPHVAGIATQAPAVTFEPWRDIFPNIWQSMQRAMGSSYEHAPELFTKASPIRHLHPQMPPILILHAEDEHMFPLEIAQQFQTQAREFGGRVEIKSYPRVEHGFLYSLERWQQQQAFEDLMAFAANCARAA